MFSICELRFVGFTWEHWQKASIITTSKFILVPSGFQVVSSRQSSADGITRPAWRAECGWSKSLALLAVPMSSVAIQPVPGNIGPEIENAACAVDAGRPPRPDDPAPCDARVPLGFAAPCRFRRARGKGTRVGRSSAVCCHPICSDAKVCVTAIRHFFRVPPTSRIPG